MVDVDEMLRHEEGLRGLIEKDEISNLAGYVTNIGDLMGIYSGQDSERSGAIVHYCGSRLAVQWLDVEYLPRSLQLLVFLLTLLTGRRLSPDDTKHRTSQSYAMHASWFRAYDV